MSVQIAGFRLRGGLRVPLQAYNAAKFSCENGNTARPDFLF